MSELKLRSDRDLGLSVAMIVRDAADVLADTLDSVRAIADEIVVMDTGSMRRTLDDCPSRGGHRRPDRMAGQLRRRPQRMSAPRDGRLGAVA